MMLEKINDSEFKRPQPLLTLDLSDACDEILKYYNIRGSTIEPLKQLYLATVFDPRLKLKTLRDLSADCFFNCWRHTRYFEIEIPSDDLVDVENETPSGPLKLTESSGTIEIVSLREGLKSVDALLSELEVPPMQSDLLDTPESSEIEDTLDIRNETKQNREQEKRKPLSQ